MADFILITGDKADFLPPFEEAIVTPLPGDLKGTGPATLNGKQVCIDGDEKDVKVDNCVYFTPEYCIPGMGTLKIDALDDAQKAKKTNTDKKPVLLKGQMFKAKFEVTQPAKKMPPAPGPPVPDPKTAYKGQGSFITTNTMFKGS